MTDIEREVALFLKEATGIPTFLEKPADAPEDYVVVEQTGGGFGLFDQVTVDVDCYAPKKSRKRARATAETVCAAACDLDVIADVYQPEVVNVYRQNDPDTGESRYVVQVEFYVCA